MLAVTNLNVKFNIVSTFPREVDFDDSVVYPLCLQWVIFDCLRECAQLASLLSI